MLEIIAIAVAGAAAGAINTIVGSGSLVTFPVLVALGYPPVIANVTNTVGLVPGSVAGAYGYRRELAGQKNRITRLGVASLLGAIVGAMLLLMLPASVFDSVVPVIIAIAVLLVIFQSRLDRLVASRRDESGDGGWLLTFLVFLTGVYGGYFSAAQGILLLAVLGLGLSETLQRVNALKNVLQALVNLVATVVFAIVADVAWLAAGILAVGAIIGGQLGAHYGRKLPPVVLRGMIVVIGAVAIVMMV